MGISGGLSQSVVIVTSEVFQVKFISESLQCPESQLEMNACILPNIPNNGTMTLDPKFAQPDVAPGAPLKWHLQLSVWAGIALTQGCVGAVPPLLSTRFSPWCCFMRFLTSLAQVGRHIHTGCILGALLKQGPTDHLHQAQGQSELKTEVYFGPVVTGARYVLVAQFLAVNFLGEQMKKELVAVK